MIWGSIQYNKPVTVYENNNMPTAQLSRVTTLYISHSAQTTWQMALLWVFSFYTVWYLQFLEFNDLFVLLSAMVNDFSTLTFCRTFKCCSAFFTQFLHTLQNFCLQNLHCWFGLLSRLVLSASRKCSCRRPYNTDDIQ